MPVVIVKMGKGRSAEQKKRIIQEFTDTLVATLGVDPGLVTVLIEELDQANIGKAGIPMNEIRK